jgi:hypothetical protein
MIDLLRPMYVGPKIRLGRDEDGGYITTEKSINDSVALFSYGLADEISFEEDYIKISGKNSHSFDHTIDKFQYVINEINKIYPDNFLFNKEGLSGTETEETNNFIEHYKQRNINGRVLLKMDVERAEYEYFYNTNIELLSKITTGIIVEFHNLDSETDRNKFIDCINRLREYFYICHVHGNNAMGTFSLNNYKIPQLLEITFVPKELNLEAVIDTATYPTELDRSNILHIADYDLSFLSL